MSSGAGFFSFNLWVFFGDNGNGQMYNQMQFLLCYFSIVMHRQRNLLLICLDMFCLVFVASIFTTSVKKSGSSCNSVVVKHFDNQFQFQLKQKNLCLTWEFTGSAIRISMLFNFLWLRFILMENFRIGHCSLLTFKTDIIGKGLKISDVLFSKKSCGIYFIGCQYTYSLFILSPI